METLTTISELARSKDLTDQQIRVILQQHEINPVEKKKSVINGFCGHPYLIDQVENVLKHYARTKEKPKRNHLVKKYPNEYVCKILRKNIKHYLNNREIFLWNAYDWAEFNKLNEAENGNEVSGIENASKRNSRFVNK